MAPPSRKAGEAAASSAITKFVRILASAGAAIGAVLVLVMLAIVGFSVFMRYVLGSPVTWTDELSGYLVVGVVMFGVADALFKGDHFGVDLVTNRALGVWRLMVELWGHFAIIALGCALLYSAYLMVTFSVDFGMFSEGYLKMPMWIPQSTLIVGATLLIVSAMALIVDKITRRNR